MATRRIGDRSCSAFNPGHFHLSLYLPLLLLVEHGRDRCELIAERMFCERLPADHLSVRLLGMGVSGLDVSGVRQGLLFDQQQRQKQSDLDSTRDQIRERFGSSALLRAASLPHQRRPRAGADGE